MKKLKDFRLNKLYLPLVFGITLLALLFNEVVYNAESLFAAPTCENKLQDQMLLKKLQTASGKDNLKVCLIEKKSNNSNDIKIHSYQIGTYNIIFINKNVLSAFAKEEIFMHEAGHLKYNHPEIRRILFVAAFLFALALGLDLIDRRKWKVFILCILIGSAIQTKTYQYIYLYQEYSADEFASQNAQKNNLIRFFQVNMRNNKNWIEHLFQTHPSPSDRINYLQNGQRRYDLF